MANDPLPSYPMSEARKDEAVALAEKLAEMICTPGRSRRLVVPTLEQALAAAEQRGREAGLAEARLDKPSKAFKTGFEAGAVSMRGRAAKVCEAVAKGHAALQQGYRVDACLACANQVRALPLVPAQEGER